MVVMWTPWMVGVGREATLQGEEVVVETREGRRRERIDGRM
jgi:hypothetical protein